LLGYLFLAPTIIGLLVFIVGPMIGSLGLSFYKWNVFRPPEFIGLANFQRLFADPRVFVSFKNTLILVVMTVALLEVLAFLLALSVNRLARRSRRALRLPAARRPATRGPSGWRTAIAWSRSTTAARSPARP
jgi:multiple sugar transport system permease protein